MIFLKKNAFPIVSIRHRAEQISQLNTIPRHIKHESSNTLVIPLVPISYSQTTRLHTWAKCECCI